MTSLPEREDEEGFYFARLSTFQSLTFLLPWPQAHGRHRKVPFFNVHTFLPPSGKHIVTLELNLPQGPPGVLWTQTSQPSELVGLEQ